MDSSWSEVIPVRNVIAAKRREIIDCQRAGADTDQCQNERLIALHPELEDWTWPARLADNPYKAWFGLSNDDKNRQLRSPQHCRESAWILLNRRRSSGHGDIESALWGVQHCEMLQDTAILRACLEKGVVRALSSEPLVPTPSILQDRGLVVLILRQIPSFLRQGGIPDEFFQDRDLFEATSQCIRLEPDDSDMLRLFSSTLGIDEELVLQTLGFLRGQWRRYRRVASFVGLRLSDNAEFCLRAAEALATPEFPTDKGCLNYDFERRRLLDLSDLSKRLRENADVVLAFYRHDATNLAQTPQQILCDATIVHAVCEARPSKIRLLPPSPARSGLESSLPFVRRLLKEIAPQTSPRNTSRAFRYQSGKTEMCLWLRLWRGIRGWSTHDRRRVLVRRDRYVRIKLTRVLQANPATNPVLAADSGRRSAAF